MPLGTPNYPTTLDDINSLGGVADNFLTTLSADVDDTDATLPVATTTGAALAGWLVIDDEIVSYTGKTSNTFTGCVRGVSGTTAASHSSGANVEDLAIATHREVLRAAIELIETKLGTGSAIAVAKLAALTASRAVATDGSGFLTATSVTAAELAFLSGVTSALQTQLNAKQASGNYVTALTGDVTATGPGSAAATIATNAVTTAKILDANVTLAKLANLADNRLLGNASGGAAAPSAISLGFGLLLASGVLSIPVPTPVVLTSSANVAVDAAARGPWQLTLGHNVTLGKPSNMSDEQVMHFHLIQDGTGSRTLTLHADYVVASDIGTVTLPTGAGKRARMTCIRYAGTDKIDVVAFTKEF